MPLSLFMLGLSACAGRDPAAGAAQPAAMATPTVAREASMQEPGTPPATRREPVVDVYHGVSVRDDYRWLEQSDDDEVRAWSAAQNAHARAVLDALPGRAAIAARVAEVFRAPHARYHALEIAGGRWFVLVDRPPKQQPFLVVMESGGDPAAGKAVLDPNVLDPTGKTTIDWFVPSPDGRRVAVSLSRAGTEDGDVHVIDVDSGAEGDLVPRVNGGTAGGDLAWTEDGKGFYYTRYPAPGERPAEDLAFFQQLYFHRLGAPVAEDRYELGEDFPRIAEVRVEVEPRGGRVLCSVQLGDGGQFSHYLRSRDGRWRKLADFLDGIVHVGFGPPGGDLIAVSRNDAPRGVILRVDGKKLDFKRARVVHAPPTDSVVTDFWSGGAQLATARRVYSIFQLGGPSVVRGFDYAGTPVEVPAPFEVASVRGLAAAGEGAFVANFQSFVEPAAWYRFEAKSGALEKTALASGAPVMLEGVRVVREFASSRDGTKVPMTLLLPPGAQLDGESPCVVIGYGGYGVSIAPRFSNETALWLERGVTLVFANLRGGGEFGEAWHRDGMLERKQNVFDDFAAVLSHVVERGYTRPERLGIIGGSNGGLLMGAMLTQHPELVRAAVSFVGLYDMLRVELSPNGAFNVTEFGSVKERSQFEALHAYSPYHNVKDGVAYPATLFLTGDNDPRVDPMQSRKMTARLQAATRGTAPILLRTSAAAGHGGGSDLDETIAQTTDAFAFMLDALGVL